MLRQAQGRNETIWILSDLVGYGPYPVEYATFVNENHNPQNRDKQWTMLNFLEKPV